MSGPAPNDGGLPAGLASPARRALKAAGYTRLEQLARADEMELLGLHGMGPKALETIRAALREAGLHHPGEEGGALTTEPKLESREERPYISIPIRVTLKEWGRANALVPEVFGWLARHGHVPAGALFYRYWVIGGLDTEFDLEVGVPVAAPVEGDERVRPGSVPAGTYLVYHHHGHPDKLKAVHDAVEAWAASRDIAFRMLGGRDAWSGRFESFLTNPEVEPDPNRWTVELAYQVEDGTLC